MRNLRGSQSCLPTIYGLTDALRGATLAYPIPIRHPKVHHGGGIGSSLCGSFSTIDPARYGIDWPRSSLWACIDVSGETKIEFCFEVAPRGNEVFISTPPSSERLQPKPHPPPDKGLTLVVAEVTTLRYVVFRQVALYRNW